MTGTKPPSRPEAAGTAPNEAATTSPMSSRMTAGCIVSSIAKACNPWRNLKTLWPSTAAKSRRLLALDGVRLIAIIWLISSEAWTAVFWPPTADRVQFLGVTQYVLNADLAYDILLLVSGICITSMVLAEVDATGRFDMANFVLRRWLSIWPALAAGLVLTVLLAPNGEVHCRNEWWAVLLFVNNYINDLQCMPQTWLVAVIFQLYMLTPLLLFACVNFQTKALRQSMSGYILLAFLSIVPVFFSWLFYEVYGDAFVYSPTQWPPGPYFKGVFLRWAPYLSGMTIALMKWDTSVSSEEEEEVKEAQGMPLYEEIQERMPIHFSEATSAPLVGDFVCAVVAGFITFQGTQQSTAFLALMMRVAYGWVLSRLIYRLLDHAYPGVEGLLATPLSYMVSQIAYSCLVLQGLTYYDIRGLLSVAETAATEPIVQSVGLYLLSWTMIAVAMALLGTALCLVLRKPLKQLEALWGDQEQRSKLPTEPLRRQSKSQKDLEAVHRRSKSLEAQSVKAVHDTSISVWDGASTAVKTFPDSCSPVKGTKYFTATQPPVDHPGGYWVFSVVTAYNEGGEDMADTLISLHEQTKNLAEGRKHHVLLVFDGWSKISASMKRYLARLYPGSVDECRGNQKGPIAKRPTPSWFTTIAETSNNYWYSEALPVTFSLQQVDKSGCLAEVDIAPGRSLYVTTIIKYDNRRKHNSHEWYLRAFGKQYESKFMHLTDVGTTADPQCLTRLVNYMDINTDYVAVTGYQRVQRLKRGASLVQHLQREVQAYELGPANCSNVKASQAVLGFELILSGPCQIIRTEDALHDEFLDAFFTMINQDPADVGICHANLQLTEDMAFGCYLYAMTTKKTGYVPDAYFNYDVETAPDRFMKQRRRWMNGIVGGLNGAINPTANLWWSKSVKPLHLKLRNLVVMIQQYILVMQFLILPAIYAYNIFLGLGGFNLPLNSPAPTDTFPFYAVYYDYIMPLEAFLPWLGVFGYYAFLSFWVISHRNKEYIPWLYHTILVINLMIGVMTLAFIFGFFASIANTHGTTMTLIVVVMYSISITGPLISSIAMGDSYGFLVGLVNIPFMMAFLPMWIVIGAYSMARFVDYTWGNRPHESESADGARRDAFMKKSNVTGMYVILMYILGNVLLTFGLVGLSYVWNGNTLMIYLILFGPYGLTSSLGLAYNLWYAGKYKWAPYFLSMFKDPTEKIPTGKRPSDKSSASIASRKKASSNYAANAA